MKNKDFKLLVEGFNRFLMKEHIGHSHSAVDDRLFNAIPQEFSDYINDQMTWFNGDAYTSEIDFSGDKNSEDDHNLLFEKVAEALGCLTYIQEKQDDGTVLKKPSFKNMLVNYDDNYREDLDYSGGSVSADDFLNSYSSTSGLSGEFTMNGASLKGFYYRLGTTCGLEGQFKSTMSERSLKGLVFVAPDCSDNSLTTHSEEEHSGMGFKNRRGSGFRSLK